MEGLANYGSDDECEESPAQSHSPSPRDFREYKERALQVDSQASLREHQKGLGDNYEDVGMDLSENEDKSDGSSHTPPHTEKSTHLKGKDGDKRDNQPKSNANAKSYSPSRHRSRSRSRSSDRNKKRKRDRKERKRSRSRSKSRSRSRSHSPSRRRQRDKYDRDRYKRDRDDKRDDKREDKRYNTNNRRRDSRSRNTRLSQDYRKETPRDMRDMRPNRFTKRFDRASNKLAHLEKMGIDVNKSQEKKDSNYAMSSCHQMSMTSQEGDSILAPGVTGRLREQMERRKALWHKKEPDVGPGAASAAQEVPLMPTQSGKVWQATTFAHDQEGKQANKFKRLMGIREGASTETSATDVAKQQEEMFTSMEQQYEVARTATHTMRGVGLGFGSFQR